MNTLLSISGTTEADVSSIAKQGQSAGIETYTSVVPEFPNTLHAYTEHLHSTFKGHWQNAMSMYGNANAFKFSNFQTQVIGTTREFDIPNYISNAEELPHNVIEFYYGVHDSFHFYDRPKLDITLFRCEYSTFIKFSQVWRMLDSYKDYTYIFDSENLLSMSHVLYKHAYNHNIQFTFREFREDDVQHT